MLKNKLLATMGGSTPSDPNFANTVLLLHGNGTNGAQNNTFVDSSPNNFTITRSGNVTQGAFSPFSLSGAEYNPATHGGSGYFDGSGDYLSLASDEFRDGDFCFEAWVYPFNVTSNYTIASDNDSTPSTTLRFSDGKFAQKFNGSWITGTTVISNNTWNHVAVTRSSGVVRLFVNGVQEASLTTADTYVFRHIGGTSAGGNVFNGYLSNVRFVRASVYTSNFTPPTAPLTAISNTRLLLNFTNAGIVDHTAKNVLETVGNSQVSTGVKKYGTGAMYFDGTGDFLGIPYSDAFWIGSGDYTCECWVNLSVYGEIVGAFDGATQPYPGWLMSTSFGGTSGKLTVFFANQTGTFPTDSKTISSAATVPTNTWTHIAFTKQGTSIRLFINGNLDTTATLNMNGSTTVGRSNKQINIGADSNSATAPGRLITGYIDDLRITKGVARYTANFTPPALEFPNK